MNIRYYSDMHLDFYRGPKDMWFPPVLPDDKNTTLLLSGDVWRGTDFIHKNDYSWISLIAQRFKQVLIVLGNHDYWPCDQSISIVRGGEICNSLLIDSGFYNVKVLDCDTYLDEDVLFVGATLWTDLSQEDPFVVMNMPNYMMPDSEIAYDDSGQLFSSEKWLQTHYRHKDYLRHVVEQNKDKVVVIMTHHVPLIELGDPNFEGHQSNGYFMNDLSTFVMDNDNIKMWVSGHVHVPSISTLNQCCFLNNAVGYPGEGFNELHHEPLVITPIQNSKK